MVTSIDNSQDVIDSRDIIARIEELEDERQTLVDEFDEKVADEERGEAEDEISEWDNDNLEELETLKALAEEGESCSDWTYGATLIREDYFEEYCQEMLEDIGELPRDLPHYIVIDWKATADNIRQDYTEINFAGETYLVRS